MFEPRKKWSPGRLAQDAVTKSLKNGGFVPFLGAGASIQREVEWKTSTGETETALHSGWVALIGRMQRLRASFCSDPSGATGPETRYCESLAKVHGIGLPDLATMALVDSVVSEEMLQFQKALVRLGVTLVDAFGKSLAKSDECLELALNDSVNIDEGSLEALELSLVSALITLHALDSEDGLVGRADESRLEKAGEAFGPPPFQSSHIVFKLVGLSYLLL